MRKPGNKHSVLIPVPLIYPGFQCPTQPEAREQETRDANQTGQSAGAQAGWQVDLKKPMEDT